jgi:hypothetical protein
LGTRLYVITCVLIAAGLALGQGERVVKPARTLRFGGIEWWVKDSGARKIGPGPNWFSADNVELDAKGRLHLKATSRDGGCVSAEIVTLSSLGYGTYRFTIDSNLDRLSKNLVLGLFTWDDTSAESFHREMDVEIGRWGDENAADAQYVIQPYSIPANIFRFRLTRGLAGSVHSFTWGPDRAAFRSDGVAADGSNTLIQERVFERMIPEHSDENARINLWCANPKAGLEGRTDVIVSKFEFVPAR